MSRPTSPRRPPSSRTPSAAATACATPPRRCSSTARSPRSSSPGLLASHGVALHCDEASFAIAEKLAAAGGELVFDRADEGDWETEYLAPEIAVKCVEGVDEAIAHVNRYGTHHSEAIVAEDGAACERFLARVDAAAVYANASTAFTDGGQFGMGAEIGISTQKLHARGPFALRALTSYKYVLRGDGQVRA